MSQTPARKRRWYQFSLRTLLLGVALLAVPLGYVGWEAKIVRERKAWSGNSHFLIVEFDASSNNISWIRRLLGDFECMFAIADESVTDADLDACRTSFPEASVFRDKDALYFRLRSVHSNPLP